MPRTRVTVLLAITLLFTNAWCVAQCSVTPTPDHVPPCHRQHQSVKPCAQPVLVEAPHPAAPTPLAVLGPAPAGLILMSTSRAAESPEHPVSPPHPRVSTPLRV
ncbi:MAG TPA: hypothetical protein VG456_05020 [Candidatus Sulfopaludibacter sp.]|nr:hypothetical protein [Candidatus Sulfopaludibacter sp.]